MTTVTRMGIRELRDTLTQTIRRVRNGESIEITHDGKPVARIVPHHEGRIAQMIAEGKLHPPRRPRTYPLPPPVKQTGPISASEALADDRGD
ncbi:MAG: type II toxin-antitoxin system prevent-host-death family antitoxin [Actinomycetota bacterium]